MKFTSIIEKILNPIDRYKATFLFLTFVFFIPEIFSSNYLHSVKVLIIDLAGNECVPLVFVYFVCCIAYLFSKKSPILGNGIIFLAHFFIYAFFFVELFLFLLFDAHINANILQMIEETNGQESSEFLETYLLTGKFILVCGITCFIICLEFLTHKALINYRITQNSILRAITSLIVFSSICVFCHNISFLSFNFAEDWTKTEGMKFRRSSFFYAYESISQFLYERQSFVECAKSNENVNARSTDSHKKNIIVIIGESFIKSHSSLYGYPLQTNPKLSNLENLFVFDNVISPNNATSDSFKKFLSFSSIDDDKNWSETPLFPAVFKAAGYNVVFFSNQFVSEVNMDTHDASCGFFNHPSIAPNLFNHRNSEKFQYDEDLLNSYKQSKNKIESDSLNLIFFHLIGQHVMYSSRFPKNMTHFTQKDYGFRKELSDSQKQDVADYDNATLYNDSIVYEIMTMFDSTQSIVLYFADHGDEVHDYRPHVGRSRNLDAIGAPGLHCQLDIPFLIHFSNSYVEKYPDDVERIKQAVHKPFMIDDLPHVLLDIAQIDYELYKPERSLINSRFNDKRKRIVRPLISSSIDYDSVCSKYGEWKTGF